MDDAPATLTTREMHGYGNLWKAAAIVEDDMRECAARQARNHERLAAIFRDLATLASTGSLAPEVDRIVPFRLADAADPRELVERDAKDVG